MRLRLAFISLFAVIFLNSTAQNIVGNSLFDSNSKKTIHRPMDKKMKGFPPLWTAFGEDVNIDYFNHNSSTFHGYPILKSLSSGGRIGFPFYNHENKLAALQTRMVKPLVKGKKYEVSMVIAQCVYSKYAIDRIPFIFSEEALSTNDIKTRSDITVNVLKLDRDIGYNQRWVKVHMVYTAKGGERYFTLISTRDKFSKPSETIDVQGCSGSSVLDKYFDNVGYYFIDAIEVIETKDDYEGECFTELSNTNANDEELIKQVEELKKKKIIHPTSPTQFKKMKDFTHHIVLFDVSGSMQNNIERAKSTFRTIYANVKDSDLVTGIVFTHFSRMLFKRESRSPKLNKRVNELQSSGGTVLESGLMLVNNNIVADENTKIYLITDVGNSQVSKKLDQYISIQLKPTKQFANYYEYDYLNNYTEKDFYSVREIYDVKSVFKVHNMSRKDAKKFEESLETDNYKVNAISQCKFGEKNEGEEKINMQYNTRNYVFLVDASSSMRLENKMDNVKKSIVKFTGELSPSDVSSLITYAAKPELIVDRISNRDIGKLNAELQKVNPSGGTGATTAINYTYKQYAGKDRNHQDVTVLMLTDGVFKVTTSLANTIEKNRNVHFKVFQFGGTKNPRLQKLESKKLLEYNLVKMEEIYEYLSKTKDGYEKVNNPYSKAKGLKKATKFL